MDPILKPWLLYVIIGWHVVPGPGALGLGVLTENQRTVVIGFDHKTECFSVSKQVGEQVQQTQGAPFFLKANVCLPCQDIVEDKSRCPQGGTSKSGARR